jgi:hypothetical protein
MLVKLKQAILETILFKNTFAAYCFALLYTFNMPKLFYYVFQIDILIELWRKVSLCTNIEQARLIGAHSRKTVTWSTSGSIRKN